MAHLSYKIGAMSFPNEGFEVWAKAIAGNKTPTTIQPTATWDRIIESPSSLKTRGHPNELAKSV
jgi:hypothetical protein